MNVKKFIASSAISGAVLLSLTTPAFAAAEHLNWGSELNASQCQKVGKPVVNVTQKIVNDADSGEGGNYWAFDTITRQIQVWKSTTVGQYCAEISYQGRFDAQSGQQSPGNTATLGGDEDGVFQGGYRATVTGDLLETPTWKTNGHIGTTDYQCDLSGNCPGAVSWPDQYFGAGYDFSYDWWGWIYRNGKHIWINASTGNSGDVL